jgi:hypothetical protein
VILDKKMIWKDSELVIAGTPDTILREINKYVGIGVIYFTIYFPDLPNIMSLELFAKISYLILEIDNIFFRPGGPLLQPPPGLC